MDGGSGGVGRGGTGWGALGQGKGNASEGEVWTGAPFIIHHSSSISR